MTDRTAIINRIANLRARAEFGATEAEAKACIKMSAKLMQAYHISEIDLNKAEASGEVVIEIMKERMKEFVHKPIRGCRTPNMKRVSLLAVPVAEMNYCKVVNDHGDLVIVGEKHDVENTKWVLENLDRFFVDSYKEYKRKIGFVGRGGSMKASFEYGLVQSITATIKQIIHERGDDITRAIEDDEEIEVVDGVTLNSKNALVLVEATKRKEEAVDKKFRELYPSLQRSTRTATISRETAYQAGYNAGKNAPIGRPVAEQKYIAG